MEGSTLGGIIAALSTGLPVLLAQLVATLILLAIGVAIYTRLTPYDELALVRAGQPAGGISFAGAVLAIAMPLAATLATSGLLIDIVIWGVVAVVVQLLAFLVANRLVRDLCAHIADGNVAAATTLAGIQVGVGLINAAAMAG